jgi:transposase
MPIFSHESGDLNMFRYISSNLILQGLCKNQDIVDAFHVLVDSVSRWKKKLSEEGERAFFKPETRHGRSHKLLPHVLDRIQGKLNKGKSAYTIAKEEGISEGSIRYAFKLGRLKKKSKSEIGSAKTRSERSQEDAKAAEDIGIAATR